MTGIYVMNRKNGKAYALTTQNLQTRNRVQLLGTGIRHPEHTQAALSSLVSLNRTDATICHAAEKIIRGKQKRSEGEAVIVELYKLLQSEVRSEDVETLNQENA